MWFIIAAFLSLMVDNHVCFALLHGLFGRFYIAFWLIVYADVYIPFIKNVLTKVFN